MRVWDRRRRNLLCQYFGTTESRSVLRSRRKAFLTPGVGAISSTTRTTVIRFTFLQTHCAILPPPRLLRFFVRRPCAVHYIHHNQLPYGELYMQNNTSQLLPLLKYTLPCAGPPCLKLNPSIRYTLYSTSHRLQRLIYTPVLCTTEQKKETFRHHLVLSVAKQSDIAEDI